MIAILYRWKIKAGREQEFEQNWAAVTKAIREQCGSYGSRLHVASNGDYVAYAQWPDESVREVCELDSSVAGSRKSMSEAIDSAAPYEVLQIKLDLITTLNP